MSCLSLKQVYLAMTNSTQLTPRHASSTYIQISGESGLRKENTPGLVPLGLWYRMLIPSVMKGLEKSITFSLTYVIVRGATARSATWDTAKSQQCSSPFVLICSNNKLIITYMIYEFSNHAIPLALVVLSPIFAI